MAEAAGIKPVSVFKSSLIASCDDPTDNHTGIAVVRPPAHGRCPYSSNDLIASEYDMPSIVER